MTSELVVHQPGRLEVFITLLAGKLSGRTYAEYVEQLPLAGNERVFRQPHELKVEAWCLEKA